MALNHKPSIMSQTSDDFDMYTDDEDDDSKHDRASVAISSLPPDTNTTFTNNNKTPPRPPPPASKRKFVSNSHTLQQRFSSKPPKSNAISLQKYKSITTVNQSNNIPPPPPPSKNSNNTSNIPLQKYKSITTTLSNGSNIPPPPSGSKTPTITSLNQSSKQSKPSKKRQKLRKTKSMKFGGTSLLKRKSEKTRPNVPKGLPPPPPSMIYLYSVQDDEEKFNARRESYASNMGKREMAVAELIATELTYCRNLVNLIAFYADKLENSKFLSKNDWQIIFPATLKTLTNLNTQLLKDLSKRKVECPNDDALVISDILLGFAPYFKMYQLYISASNVQLKTVTKCLENSKFYQFQQQTRKKFNNLSLSDLIILPVQRIPRYKLLIAEIVKHTKADHIDYNGLKEALSLIEQINAENNEKLKDLESRMKVLNITNSMEKAPDLTSASRVFIFESILYKIKQNGKLEKLSFYLFNDSIIYSTPLNSKNKKCVFKMRLPIDSAFAVQKMKNTQKYNNVFAIYSSLESFMCSTKDDNKLHLQWIELLEKCLIDAKNCYYFHGSSRNAMMGRGSVLITQAPLQLPKALRKELNKQLETKRKQQQQRVSQKDLINLMIDEEQVSMFDNDIQTRQYAPSRRTGLFSYNTFGIGSIAEEELSDDEKEFFMPTVSKVKSVSPMQMEKSKKRSIDAKNGFIMKQNEVVNARKKLKKSIDYTRKSRDDSAICKRPPPFKMSDHENDNRRRSNSFGSGSSRKKSGSPFKQPQRPVRNKRVVKKPKPPPNPMQKKVNKMQKKEKGLIQSSKTSVANGKEAKVNGFKKEKIVVHNRGVSDIRSKLKAFEQTDDDDVKKEPVQVPKANRQKTVKAKVVKPYTGDPKTWNTYLDTHNGSEPTNEWMFHKWIKGQKDIETISFKQARDMFKGCRNRGRL